MTSTGTELRVEVMQLSAPTFHEPIRIPQTEEDSLENDLLANLNQTPLTDLSKLLLLPQNLLDSYIGEQFKICCSIRLMDYSNNFSSNLPINPISDINIKVTISKDYKDHTILLNPDGTVNQEYASKIFTLYEASNLSLNELSQSLDFVCNYDLKSAGVYRLNITTNYHVTQKSILDNSENKIPKQIMKRYDIKVTPPLKISIEYPNLNAKTIVADVKIENLSKSDMILTVFDLICVNEFEVVKQRAINSPSREESNSVSESDDEKFSAGVHLKPHETTKKIFQIQLKSRKPLVAGKYKFGKLNIAWNRQMSNTGRLNSSILDSDRMAGLECAVSLASSKSSKSTKLTHQKILTKIPVHLSIINTSKSDISINLNLKPNNFLDPVKFIGNLWYQNLTIASGEEKIIESNCISSRRGIFHLPKIIAHDNNSKNSWVFQENDCLSVR